MMVHGLAYIRLYHSPKSVDGVISNRWLLYLLQIVKRRLALVQTETNMQELEKKIGMGQIEEVIEQVRERREGGGRQEENEWLQAEYELEACRSIVDSKAWEPLVEEAPKNQWTWPVA